MTAVSLISQVDPMLSQGSLNVDDGGRRERTKEVAAGEGCDLLLLASKMEEESREQEGQAASGSWKKVGKQILP